MFLTNKSCRKCGGQLEIDRDEENTVIMACLKCGAIFYPKMNLGKPLTFIIPALKLAKERNLR